jgi:hypothetical protein
MLESMPTGASPRTSRTKSPSHVDPPLIVDRPKTVPSTPSPVHSSHSKPRPKPEADPTDAHRGAAHVKSPKHHAAPAPSGADPLEYRHRLPTDGDPMAGTTKPTYSPEVRHLIDLAKKTRAGHTWNPDAPLIDGRNAHRTNLPNEMEAGIKGDFNWFEGDLRVDSHGTPVLSHDTDTESDGLKLNDWLAIGKASRRGLKFDVKESTAMPGLVKTLQEHKEIPQGRIMMNVGAGDVAAAGGAKRLRAALPKAWMAINPSTNESGHYDAASLKSSIEMAKEMGGRIAFPIRWDIADDATIKALKPYGKISIWTAKSEGTPDDPEAERQRLIDRGVDGVIDLGEPSPWYQKAFQHLKDLTETSAGRHLIEWGKGGIDLARQGGHLVQQGLHDGIELGKAGLHAATEGAGNVVSSIGDGISHLGDGLPSIPMPSLPGFSNPFG